MSRPDTVSNWGRSRFAQQPYRGVRRATRAKRTGWFAQALLAGTLCATCACGQPPPLSDRTWRVGEPVETGMLEKNKIKESSGLAASPRHPHVYWTHNDSGGKPEFYAFDLQGNDLGTSNLVGAKNQDWESLDSFSLDGVPYLLVGDVGDNARRRPHVSLYLAQEPEDPRDDCQLLIEVRLRYATGPIDCEALVLDTQRREVLLFEKQIRRLTSRVYCLKWPGTIATVADAPRSRQVFVAQPVAEVPQLAITGADLSGDNRHLIVNTYGDLFLYQRLPQEDWSSALKRRAMRISGPPRAQGEAVCFDHDTLDLVLTSEGKSSPIWKIPLQPITGQRPNIAVP